MNTMMLSAAGVKGGRAPKHHWTDEELEIVRRDYKGTTASCQEIADRLGVTKWGVKGKAAALGILQPKSPDWTPEEDERLRQLIHTHSVTQVAKMMHRSGNAVKIRATRLKLGLRIHVEWFTKKDVCEILGVDHHKVQAWIDEGMLDAAWHGENKPQAAGMAMWHIGYEALKTFIIKNSEILVGRNVDLQHIVWLLTKDNGPAGVLPKPCAVTGAGHRYVQTYYEKYICRGACECGAVKFEASLFSKDKEFRKILNARIKYLNETQGKEGRSRK